MLPALLTVALAQLPAPFDFIDNAEIGDAEQYVAWRSKGHFEATLVDKKAGNTAVTGTWKMSGDTVEVKSAACKGARCADAKKDWTARVTVEAARAMTVASTAPAPLLPSGSYYCHYLGCERRLGVAIVSRRASQGALRAVEDTLIARNVGRNSTVVWIDERPAEDTPASRIERCGRDPERAQRALDTLKADLAGLDLLGEVTIAAAAARDCLWDVRLTVRDDAQAPGAPRR